MVLALKPKIITARLRVSTQQLRRQVNHPQLLLQVLEARPVLPLGALVVVV